MASPESIGSAYHSVAYDQDRLHIQLCNGDGLPDSIISPRQRGIEGPLQRHSFDQTLLLL